VEIGPKRNDSREIVLEACSKPINVSEENDASIFRTEEQNKQETNRKQVTNIQFFEYVGLRMYKILT
jgi:hypothetical protein